MKKTLFLLLFIQLSVSAGVVFEIETKDHKNDNPTTAHAYADGRNLKMEIQADQKGKEGELIFRGDELVIVDHDKKSYMVFDKEAMKSLSGQVSQATSMMEDALKNVPAEQRAMVEKMMKERMPKTKPQKSTRSVKNTGVRKKINGYPCVRHDAFNKGKKTRELWVTDWDNVDGGGDAREAFEGLAKFFKQMMDSIGEMTGGQSPIGDNPFAEMDELGGFPVLTRGFGENGELEDESTLKSSKRQRLDPSEFEPPSGYKRRSMFSGN